jgi:hypothetical protein
MIQQLILKRASGYIRIKVGMAAVAIEPGVIGDDGIFFSDFTLEETEFIYFRDEPDLKEIVTLVNGVPVWDVSLLYALLDDNDDTEPIMIVTPDDDEYVTAELPRARG